MIGDADIGGQLPFSIFTNGLPGLVQDANQGGMDIRNFQYGETPRATGRAQQIAEGSLGNVGQMNALAGLIPQTMNDAASVWDQSLRGIFGPSVVGGGGQFGTGAVDIPGGRTGRVTDAALAALKDTGPNSELYARSAALLSPQIRSAWSSRGLGSSGQAVGDESSQMQQLADSMALRANQERAAFLGAAANAAGAEGSERVGLTNAAVQQALGLGNQQLQGALGFSGQRVQESLGRGGLGLQAAGFGPEMLASLMNTAGGPLDASSIASALQGNPLQIGGLGAGLFQQGLQIPLGASEGAYELSRDPQKALLAALAGTNQSQAGRYRSSLGIPK